MTAFPPLPPLTPGEFHTTVPGTFGVDLSGRIFLLGSFTGPLEGGPFFPFATSGPATITLRREAGTWSFESGFAEFQPTPEPATLLLVGTTAAGLGLARWHWRREREQQDAA